MTNRLTNQIRKSMLETVLDHAFLEKQNQAKIELVIAGDALYMAYHGENLKNMQKLPTSFFVKHQIMKSNIGGQYHDVALSEKKLMCYKGFYTRVVFEANNPAAIAYLQANDKIKDMDNHRKSMDREINAVLESVHTFKKLWEVWPECKSLLEKFEQKPTIAILPAIQVESLNKRLNLVSK